MSAAETPREPPRVWKTGETLYLTLAGRTVEARVSLASKNGVSLMLGFAAILEGHVGAMPVLWDDGLGLYRSLMTGMPVGLDAERPVLTDVEQSVVTELRRLADEQKLELLLCAEVASVVGIDEAIFCRTLEGLVRRGLLPPVVRTVLQERRS